MSIEQKKANCDTAILILSICYLAIVVLLFLLDLLGALLTLNEWGVYEAIGAVIIKLLLGSLLVFLAAHKRASDMISVAVFTIIFSWQYWILIVISAVILIIAVYVKKKLIKKEDSETKIENTDKMEDKEGV